MGPGGTRTLVQSPTEPGTYGAHLGDTTKGNYLDPGSYIVAAPGGASVAAFSVPFTIPVFQWTNAPASNLMNVTRSKGVTVTWTGGDPNGYVQISGGSGTTSVNASFVCQAHASAGTFTVPPAVLLAIPAAGGVLAVTSYPAVATFTPNGLDFGAVETSASYQVNATYQ
jgi:hypothetical protein